MKKTTAKPASEKKPAAKTAAASKPVVEKTAAKKTAPVAKKPAAPAPSPAPAPVKAKAPAVKKPKAAAPQAKAKAEPVTTTIIAAIDVGFGNHLTLRGEGPGLSWEAGVPLECVSDDRWSITLPESAQPVVCKFLLNDTDWCAGEDYTVLPGSSVVLSPKFL